MGKYLLRDAMRGRVPDWILFNRDKRGFDTRHADWVARGIGDAIRQGSRSQPTRGAGFLPAARADDAISPTPHPTMSPCGLPKTTTLLCLSAPASPITPKKRKEPRLN